MVSDEVLILLKNSIENEFNTIVDVYDSNGNYVNEYAYEKESGRLPVDIKDENLFTVSDKDGTYGYLKCNTFISPIKAEAIKMFINAVANLREKALVIDKVARTETLLVSRMLSEDARIYYNDIVAYGADLGYRIDHPMAIIVATLESNYPAHFNMNFEYESTTNDAKHHVLRLIKEHPYMNKRDIVALTQDNHLVVIKIISEITSTNTLYQAIDNISQMVSDILNSYRIFKYYIAPGEMVESFADAYNVYRDSINCLDYAKKMDLEQPIIKHSDVLYNTLISKLPGRIKTETIDAIVHHLLMQNHEMVSGLVECFNAFINNNFNIANTAYEAYLHRNTVKKRLDKLYKLTGFDPMGDFDDIVMLKLILQKYLVESRGSKI